MNRLIFQGAFFLALAFFVGTARAGTDEAIVYGDELNHRGEIGTEFYASLSQYPARDGLPKQRVFHALGELPYGLNDQWSVAARFPVTHVAGAWHADGAYAEIKYVAPHEAANGFYWGLELEAGRISAPGEERSLVAELAPIVGMRAGRWHLIANPGLEYASEEHGWSFQPRVKASYAVGPAQAIALEYYVDAGHLQEMSPRRLRNEVAFLVWDTVVAKHKVSAGIGHGTTPVSQRWQFKLAVELED